MRIPHRSKAFDTIARLPADGDNCAIALHRIEAETRVVFRDGEIILSDTVLVGHRFAVRYIKPGESLLSWKMPFGRAIRPIAPGDPLYNHALIEEFEKRDLEFSHPSEPNFEDQNNPFKLDASTFSPGSQLERIQSSKDFLGYEREAGRGVGTRNYIVVLGLTSRTSSYARTLVNRFAAQKRGIADLDGIVCVAHSEGGIDSSPNNLTYLLRTLAGFVVHPNVGAVLIADSGDGFVKCELLRSYLEREGYPFESVRHAFLTIDHFTDKLLLGEQLIRGWIPELSADRRSTQRVQHLRLALQCGGSDAFSGISANPLVAGIAREIVRFGGSANLAETDELVGAEAYLLANVRDLETARKFLRFVDEFAERMRWHGHSPEGNPSGGNRFRGLYNIALKSLGAATKRAPDVCLDYVIDYGERMSAPGFYFMNSPGNDLESIAGQVASGANLILFTTGHGSVTNFPFVPTLKAMTTTPRYNLLQNEMDINAGAYLDGARMSALVKKSLDLVIESASGGRTQGEHAGHSQVSIWRDWYQTGKGLPVLPQSLTPLAKPLKVVSESPRYTFSFEALPGKEGLAIDQVGLIFPSSLCSAQISHLIAERLNGASLPGAKLTRVVSLPHTEGCGVSGGASQELFVRILINYVIHPLVRFALILEHGCEKVHNEFLVKKLLAKRIDPQRFGWASVQLDGGIENVTHKVEAWFRRALRGVEPFATRPAGPGSLSLGLSSDAADLPPSSMQAFREISRSIVADGGNVIICQGDRHFDSGEFQIPLFGKMLPRPTLRYGATPREPGFHLMETPTRHWIELLTGLGASGVQIILAFADCGIHQGHPLIPTIQVTSAEYESEGWADEADLVLGADADAGTRDLCLLLSRVASRSYHPSTLTDGNVDFQITRGRLGVSV